MSIKDRFLMAIGYVAGPSQNVIHPAVTSPGDDKDIPSFVARIKANFARYENIGEQDFLNLLSVAEQHVENIPLIEGLRQRVAAAEHEADELKTEWQAEETAGRELFKRLSDSDEVVEHLSTKIAGSNAVVNEPTILIKAAEAIKRRLTKKDQKRQDANAANVPGVNGITDVPVKPEVAQAVAVTVADMQVAK